MDSFFNVNFQSYISSLLSHPWIQRLEHCFRRKNPTTDKKIVFESFKLCYFRFNLFQENKSNVMIDEENRMPEYFEPKKIETGNFLSTQCIPERFGFGKREIDSILPISTNLIKFKDVDLQVIDVLTQEPRWPIECQVIQERIRHINYTPATPEQFYTPTGREPKPKPVSEDLGTVIFNYCPTSATNYFSRSCTGGTAILSSANYFSYPQESDNRVGELHQSDLHFESRFESGNLGKVIKITDTYYQLHLRRDLYTQRHMQWFYFRISNTKSRMIYRLSIVNFCKEDSLYNEGLRPLLYSTKDANLHAIGWRRCGENITYYKNDSSDEEKEKHTLTFNITFPHDQDTVYLAHCYPYTYSDLQEYLSAISNDPTKARFTKLRLLCRTLAGNSVHYLTITAPNSTDESKKKTGIVITARVHPGETPSSWMMKGIIDFLTGESNQARELREKFIFKLVPMLNPDGVIVGNNRCSLSGKDLNRQYRTVMRESYPSVWHTKLMIRRLMEECGIAMYCDLHAHSRKPNIFIYGCESKRANCFGKLTEQIFPLMLHKNAADKFSFENCKFHIEKGKEGTSRVVMWLMGIQNSYTMEASMGGSKLGSRSGTHFSVQDYEQIGKAFCETLLDFSDEDPNKERLRNKILTRLMKEGSSADEPTNINLTDYSSDEGDTSDSSTDEVKIKSECLDSDCGENPYLLVPPPSPQFSPLEVMPKIRKNRIHTIYPDKHRVKRKIVNRRKPMDLPATDPGSDAYADLTDSADEFHPQRCTASSKDTQEKSEESKQTCTTNSLPLLRPHTLTITENLSTKAEKNPARHAGLRTKNCARDLPSSRFIRLSPVLSKSPDVQIKLSALRQQIWTGVNADGHSKRAVTNDTPDYFEKIPSDISQMTLIYQRNAFFESCSKKLEALDHASKSVTKKPKKFLKKPSKSALIEDRVREDEETKKSGRKKKYNSRRNKSTLISVINPIFDNNTNEIGSLIKLSDESNDLKLFGVGKLPKTQQKSRNEARKKFRKNALVTAAIPKLKKNKFVFNNVEFTDFNNASSSSDDVVELTTSKKTKKKKIPQ